MELKDLNLDSTFRIILPKTKLYSSYQILLLAPLPSARGGRHYVTGADFSTPPPKARNACPALQMEGYGHEAMDK